jgi:predicted nucleotidyltransferase
MAKSTPRRTIRRRTRPSSLVASHALLEAIEQVTSTLTEHGARFALVGGLAVSARAEPRMTRDADLVVSVASDSEAEALIVMLVANGYRVAALLEQTRTGRIATVRLMTRSDLLVDLLFASSGIEREIVDVAEALEIAPGITIPVARSGHLTAMKLLSRSPQRARDNDDLQALLPTLDAGEKRRVKTAIALIEKRGFARGRDLAKAWASLNRARPRR